VQGQEFDLTKFNKIKVVGFGKSSCDAAVALEKILGPKINEGAVIGLRKVSCDYIETFAGTHPEPTEVNTVAGKKIYEIIKGSDKNDLIIVLVSGGGSALLCSSLDECSQEQILYEASLKSEETIIELNTVRKHIPSLKGGNLAKIAYPATVIGLIFSDVPGDKYEDVASGPTYKDKSTMEDAEKIILKNNFKKFNLVETPKEDKYFDNVHNFVLVSNKTAVETMAKEGKKLGLKTQIVSTDLYDETNIALRKIFSMEEKNSLVLAAGEPRIAVPKNAGKGGRNLHMALEAIKEERTNGDTIFISFASDGMDDSDAAGAIADVKTLEKAKKMNLGVDDYLERFDSYNFFQKTGDIIMTGPTGTNVSDLMILLTKINE
jgi:glycerate-2-kinase